MYVTDYNMELVLPIKTATNDGNFEEATFVRLIAPSRAHSAAAAALKSIVHRAIDDNKDSGPKDAEQIKALELAAKADEGKPVRERFKPSDVINVIAKADIKGDPLNDAMSHFNKLMVNGCCEINSVPATTANLDKICLVDWHNMMGEYVANFLLNSLFD